MNTKLVFGVLLALFLCFLISSVKQSDDTITKPPTITVSLSPVLLPPPPPKVVVVKLTDEISKSWSIPLEEAFKDSNCKVVIAWIESGGGGATETQILSHRIELLKAKYKKPFIVYTEAWMMSGAYWIACDADAIIISPIAMIGSIGAYIQREDVTKQDSASGVTIYTFRSGEYKNMGDEHMPMTVSEALFWQQMVRKCYMAFLNQVLIHRYSTLENIYKNQYKVKKVDSNTVVQELVKVANGQPYFADNALKLGLCDSIRWLDEIEAEYISKSFVIDTMSTE